MIPNTRTEKYLAAIAGEDVEIPVPLTRIDKYLYQIAVNGGGSGGSSGSGLPAVTVADNGKFLQVANGVWVAVDAVPQMTELIKAVIDDTFIPISKADYDALVEAGTVDESKYYMIVG